MSPLRVAAGAAVVMVGVGLFLVGSALEGASSPRLGGTSAINVGAGSRFDLKANNSPTVVQDPVHPASLAAVNRIDAPAFSCGMNVSGDAGANWQPAVIPFPPAEEAPPRCYAPDAVFGPDGALYVSFVTLKGAGNVPNALWISTSRDGGRTLSPATRVAGPLAFQARIAADPDRPGRLYLSWLQAKATATLAFPEPGNPVVVARSDDGGASWTEPVSASAATRERVVAPSVAVGRKGELFVAYLDLQKDVLDYHGAHQGKGGEPYPGAWALVLARSSDEGRTWAENVVEPRVVPTERFVVFLAPSPSLAVDRRSGRIYVAFHDGRLGSADVWLWVSGDGGRGFSTPRRVNDTPRDDHTAQYLPKLAVAPNGRLDVVYYDRRNDREDVANEVTLQSSLDGGKTFTGRLGVSRSPFDSRIGFGMERGLPDLGSRLGLVSTTKAALAVWADTSGAPQLSRKQDVAYAVTAFTRPSPFRGPARDGGVVLALVGLLLLLRGCVGTSLYEGFRRA